MSWIFVLVQKYIFLKTIRKSKMCVNGLRELKKRERKEKKMKEAKILKKSKKSGIDQIHIFIRETYSIICLLIPEKLLEKRRT